MDETDLKYAEEEYQNQQIAEGIKNAGDSIGSLSSGIAENIVDYQERRKKDIESINTRGSNSDDNSGRSRKKDDDDSDNEDSKKKKKKNKDDDDLEKKDGLDDKKDDKDGDSDSSSSDKKDKSDSDSSSDSGNSGESHAPAGESGDGEGGGGFLSRKWNAFKRKVKIALIALAVLAAGFIVLLFISFFIYIYDVGLGSISSFFGISEEDTGEVLTEEDRNGLLTSEEYLINPETGDYFSTEELVDYLKADSTCKTTTLALIMDWFDSWDGEYSNYCGYYRFMAKHMEELEEDNADSGLQLDRGIVVSTLFYGFANQPDYTDYKSNVDLESVDEITSAYDRYASLESVIKDGGVLTKKNLQTIIDDTVLDESHTYYTWEVEEETNDDGEVIKKIGKCESSDVSYAHYSSQKWAILMRFGEEAANTYEEELQYSHSFNSSDEECKMGLTDEELKQRIIGSGSADVDVEIDGSVRRANNKFAARRSAADLSPFDQKANTETSTADIFEPYGDMDLNYMNGFAFKNFPAFEKSINNPQIELSYDYVVTPKQIEEIIQHIILKKQDVNYYLDFPDQDNNEYTQIGDYVIGANCEPYLTAAPDSIQVKVTDCDGTYITTTSFKDYIMGVAYGEVSDSGDNYVLSEMTAAISFSLHRRNNYLKGGTITMRSGNCDQVYCPMSSGCSGRKANLSCGSFKCTSYYPGGGSYHGRASQSLQEKYANYYETAKNYLVVSNGKPHSAHYVSTIQLGWKSKANRGIPFTQIIQEEYQDEGAQLIQCNGGEEATGESPTSTTEPTTGTKVGNKPSTQYPEVSPDYGKFYGFAYNDAPEGRNITIDPAWKNANIINVKTNCTSGSWNINTRINKAAQTEFVNAYKNICRLITQGVTLSDGTYCKLSTSQLKWGGDFVSRKTSSGNYSLHAYGIAQDWNYSLTIPYNGKNYKPYASQGASTKAEYDRFVKALGKEESCLNVNYILWKYAFQPAGFTWGGNWSASSWDGMHFQVKY